MTRNQAGSELQATPIKERSRHFSQKRGDAEVPASALSTASRRGLRILALVTDAHGGFGGISQHNRDVLEAMCSYSTVEEVHVLPRLVSGPNEGLPPKLSYHLGGLGGSMRYSTYALRFAAIAGCIDMVWCGHINFMPVAAAIARLKRAPLVLTVHGTDAWSIAGRLPPWLMKREISCLISVSEITRDRFLTWCDVPRERTFLVPNAIRLENYGAKPKNKDLLRRLRLEGRTVLMTLGRMALEERSKGFDRMIDLIPRLALDLPDVAYLLVGDGTERPLLEAKVTELELQNRVVFAGRVSNEEKADYYGLADAFIMLSVNDGFGIVVVEALACGVPVVVSARDGTREAVRGGELGLIADPFDPEAVRLAVLEAVQRPRGVPPGLAYFAYERFSERLRGALASVCPI